MYFGISVGLLLLRRYRGIEVSCFWLLQGGDGERLAVFVVAPRRVKAVSSHRISKSQQRRRRSETRESGRLGPSETSLYSGWAKRGREPHRTLVV